MRKLLLIIMLAMFISSGIVHDYAIAQSLSVEELQREIEKKRLEKEKLDAENKILEAQIQETNKQAKTLQTAVKSLDTTQKKLQNDLRVTETKIGSTELSIKKLAIEITDRETQIDNNKKAIAETIRGLEIADNQSLVATILQYKNINELWDSIETLKRFQESIRSFTRDLRIVKGELEEKKTEDEYKKKELVTYKVDLSDQKVVVEQNKKTKTNLLTQTQSKEAEYKKMLEKNIELGKKFEQELYLYESQLQIAIDKSKLPTEKLGILQWPLDNVFVTQKFGSTVDSKRLYVSGTHNGADFRATTGTPVKAVMSGIVEGTGNTDEQSGCYSYGRWILIKHPNGLSSMYAHLSLTKVSTGQSVASGQVIGLSGGQPGAFGSGYSTGPHLHLGLYASQGVTIQKYSQSKFCKQVSIPVAGSQAYLDPLAYLPPIN